MQFQRIFAPLSLIAMSSGGAPQAAPQPATGNIVLPLADSRVSARAQVPTPNPQPVDPFPPAKPE